jgi:glutathione synthase/RimK-type ligase-like ATP-grasp enzyme
LSAATSPPSKTRRRVAVAASARYPDLRDDWPIQREAMATLGMDATPAVWTDRAVRWDEFDLVVANGAWDNIHRPAEFLEWVDMVAETGVPIVNSPATLRWNLDKRYLGDLAAAGVPTVPTTWVAAGQVAAAARVVLPEGEVVVKPAVSGGGFRTARYELAEHDRARAHVADLVSAGATAMIQPYQSSVDAGGEVGVIALGGMVTHSVSKGPMLRRGVGARETLVDNMVIGPASPDAGLLGVAVQALAAAEVVHGPTAYARIDLVRLEDGSPAVLELELLDPALFFEHYPDGALRFARVLRDRLEAG